MRKPENPERDGEIFELVRTGRSMTEVARRFGISRQRVGQIVQRDDPDRERPILSSSRVSVEQVAEMYEARQLGREHWEEIAARFGVSMGIVTYNVARYAEHFGLRLDHFKSKHRTFRGKPVA